MEIEKWDKCDLKLYMWQHRKVLKLGSRLEAAYIRISECLRLTLENIRNKNIKTTSVYRSASGFPAANREKLDEITANVF